MRRKPKENNFKAVLETIRDLMNTDCVVPDWLHDLILGYGSPDAAHYSQYVWFDNYLSSLIIPPQTVFVGGYTVFTLSESPSDRPCVRKFFVSLIS